ncbi:MAG: hypothetical protein M3Q29_14525 [Chloroflexota bacterium]|nr:hypothetical protein [Chloroflexota bacterium]
MCTTALGRRPRDLPDRDQEPVSSWIPDLEIEASDDLGRRYPIEYRRGGGSGRDSGYEFLIPRPLDESASALMVTVTRMRWEGLEGKRNNRVLEHEETGRWIFPVPL